MNLSISLHRLRQFPRCCWLHPFSVCFTVGYQAQTAAEFSGAVKTDSKNLKDPKYTVRTMLTKPYQTCYLLIFNGLCMSLQQWTASGVPTSWPFPVCTEADEIHRKDDPTPQDLSRSLIEVTDWREIASKWLWFQHVTTHRDPNAFASFKVEVENVILLPSAS